MATEQQMTAAGVDSAPAELQQLALGSGWILEASTQST